jgi:hypothetical protein
MPVWNVTIQMYQYEVIPKQQLGRVMAAGYFAIGAAAPLGSLVAGALLSRFDTWMILGAFTGLMTVLATASTASRAIPRTTVEDVSPTEESV